MIFFKCQVIIAIICRDNSNIEDLKNALVNLSKFELSLLHICTWDFAFHIHQVFGILPINYFQTNVNLS